MAGVELSALVVNTGRRALLLHGLDALGAELARAPFASEVLVLDNASDDGSAAAARAHPAVSVVVARARRAGVPENLGLLAARASGRFLLFLNEDAEVLPGAVGALHAALAARPHAAVAAAALLAPDGKRQPSAWRFPTPLTALASLLALHPWLVVQSRGEQVREVDWAQSSAMLVRRDAFEAVGGFDPAFFVYSDEVDLQRRLRDRGHRTLYVPGAQAIHHEQLSTDRVPERRIVELARNRDRYLRTHRGRPAALAVRALTAAAYASRALAALVLPGHDPRRYGRHVAATLWPDRGDGMREAAAEYNSALARIS
jgi:N-acetylglucosaminyl-diphospho-decaprenol L-rhamnosyltransferase